MGMETWRDVAGYEGEYQVSDAGRVKSLSRELTDRLGRKRKMKEKVLSPGRERGGYQNVFLCSSNGQRNMKVHRLVAEAFVPNPDDKPMVNHIDGDKNNNAASNLEWVTRIENTDHAIRAGLVNHSENAKKATIVNRRPVVVLKNGEVIGLFPSVASAAKFTGADIPNICACCRGRKKKAKGYEYRYTECRRVEVRA